MSHSRAHAFNSSKNLKRLFLTASALALATGYNVATGPAAHAADSQSSSTVGEIVITGSRIKRTTDFETPNPTTVVDDQYLQNLGIVNLGDAMTQLPSNVSTFTPQATGNSNFFAGSTIADLRGINPYFGSRTLTLIDGRRHVPTNQGDSVDLNFIPSIILQRMDVVTGGASAAYGSGAISGVNNVILNKTLQGAKVQADYGVTGHGDGDSYHVGAAAGTQLFDGRGHLVIAGEYQKQDAVGCQTVRSWCAQNYGYISNANGGVTQGQTYTPYNPNLPNYSLVSNLHFNGISYNGVLWDNGSAGFGPASPVQATADGTGVVPFALGTRADGTPSTSVGGGAVGGDGLPTNTFTNLIGATNRHVFHGHFDYDITDDINLSLDGEYGKVHTRNNSQAFTSVFVPVTADNAYVMQNPGLASSVGFFSFLNKDWTSQVNSYSTFDTTVWSVVGDLNGSIGDSSWTWDAYVTHGHTKRIQYVADNPHLDSLNLALDAVFPYIDPTNPGLGVDTTADPVCRSTRDGSADPNAAGCTPIDPFGTQPLTQAQHDYGFGYLQENEYVNQTVAAANLTGDLFKGFGAGPVGAAVGGEYHWENIKNLNKSGAPATDYFIQYGDSFRGKVGIYEVYGELNVPVLKDVPFAQKLEFDGAVRYSHYHNVGQGPNFATAGHGLTTWKLSGVWDVTSWLRVRGSQSRDSRAGNFRELYYGQVLHAGGTFGYCGTGFREDPCDIILQGNPAVEPEKSDTSTLGVVLQPGGFLDGFQFATDYYHIKLKNGITPAGGQTQDLINACKAIETPGAAPTLCSMTLGSVIFDDPATDGNPATVLADPSTWTVQSITDLSYNAASYKVKGIDFSMNYNHQFANMDSINVRLLATKTISQWVSTALNVPSRNIVGETGISRFLPDFQSSPNWVGNLSVTYNTGGFSGTVQGRYISSGKYDYRGIEPGDVNYAPNMSYSYSTNSVPFYQIYSLNLSYTFKDVMGNNSDMQLFMTVNNLFDRDPPVNGSPVYYDRLGRRFRFGIRGDF